MGRKQRTRPVSDDCYSFVDLEGEDEEQHVQTPTQSPFLRPSALFITNDIEALLEEAERIHLRDDQPRSINSSNTNNSRDTPTPLIGLPPPPRSQRATANHSRIHQGLTAQGRGRESVMDKDFPSSGNTKVISSVSTTITNVPTVTATLLGTDVIDATKMQDNTENIHSLPNRLSEFGPKSNQHTQERWTMNSKKAYIHNNRTSPASAESASASHVNSLATHLPTRTLLTRARSNSRDSDFSSTSSHDPPSTIHEPRISVSSTIYPESTYDDLPSPVALTSPNFGRNAGSRYSVISSASSFLETDRPQTSASNVTQTSSLFETFGTRSELPRPIPTYPYTSFGSSNNQSNHNSPLPRPHSSQSERPHRSSSGPKPALPTAPKPDFRRSRSVQPPPTNPLISKPPSRSSSPKLSGRFINPAAAMFPDSNRSNSLPPTTNYLHPQERAELIRKTRKLTQVLGQAPSPVNPPEELTDSPVLNNCLLPMMPTRKAHYKGALSVPETSNITTSIQGAIDTHIAAITAERTNSLSPIRFRSKHSETGHDSDDSMSPFDSPDAVTPLSVKKRNGDPSIRSPTLVSASDSFIDMSDLDSPRLARAPSMYSLAESMTEEQKMEEDRRKKRERVAKVHRFLGSRVPTELVLGPGLGAPLPLPAPDSDILSDGETSVQARLWLRRRRNSLASSDPSERLTDAERLKMDLSDKEKAIVVKRALKMERVFGEHPPQSLFRGGPSRPPLQVTGSVSQIKTMPRSAPTSPHENNMNQSAYRKGKSKVSHRPGTSESSRRLLDPSGDYEASEIAYDGSSDVYFHYRSSLVSLTNIVDNDDRRSLVELHEYINEDLSYGHRDKRDSFSSSSIRSERRRSLPSRASHASLASQFTLSEPRVEATPFEVRRRRAAKLSHFFGVSYRNLFGEVIDSLEMSVREDQGKGTLNADEARDLLVQLRKLKARRDEFS